MALVSNSLGSGTAAVTLTTAAAPTTSETITPGWGVWLEVNIGGTATTVTVVRPGNTAEGDPRADYAIGPLTSTSRAIRIHDSYKDAVTGLATVTFSQVTGVTARLWRT